LSKRTGELSENKFWEQGDFSKQQYDSKGLTVEAIKLVENRLGYTLPRSYLDLMATQNGGIPKNRDFILGETSSKRSIVSLSGIFGVGQKLDNSLCGAMGSQFWVDEWGYPDIGIYFADCPSGGHEMLCLDYQKTGKDGEPKVVHVDQEAGFKVTVLAEDFEKFIQGLICEESPDEFPEPPHVEPWRPAEISFRVCRAPEQFYNGRLWLELHFPLDKDGVGISMARVDIPESWELAELGRTNTGISIDVGGRNYHINSMNFGPLSYDILSLSDSGDAKLEELWQLHAGKT